MSGKGRWELHEGDMRVLLPEWAKEGLLVDAVVTDPPYHLSTVKRFAKEGKNATKTAMAVDRGETPFARSAKGFMGVGWDGGDVTFRPSTWKACYGVMKPGAFLLVFGGSRTFHRVGCAIEDAGFVIHPFVAWCQGQGFPKAHDLPKAVDRLFGKEPTIVSEGGTVRRMRPGADMANRFAEGEDAMWRKLDDRTYTYRTTVPATPEAARWAGWAYGLQALKPAMEPIIVAQKPFLHSENGSNGAASILRWGVGAYNIDACRVPSHSGEPHWNEPSQTRRYDNTGPRGGDPKGRWPANLIHDGSDEVRRCFPDTPWQIAKTSSNPDSPRTKEIYGDFRRPDDPMPPRDDHGSAARFFNECAFSESEKSLLYYPKANKADRAGSLHPTVKPQALLRHLLKLVVPPGGLVLDPFAGSGSLGEAAITMDYSCIMVEKEAKYADDVRTRMERLRSTPS